MIPVNAKPVNSVVGVDQTGSAKAALRIPSRSNSATITSYTWVWGDGTADASGVAATHTFTEKGTYVVRLTIADSLGRTATVTQSLTVSAP